jgi:uncharacterized protein YdeI (YjbR/CyaY-like superfamily)
VEERILFANREEFRQWLFKNSNTSRGIWLIFGKAVKLKTIKADEALEEALCFGWIDGQFKSIDDEKYLKKFMPRRKGSKWSEKNKHIVNRLIENGQVTEYGYKAIEEAKKSGTWDMPKRVPILNNQIEILINALNGAEPALSNFLKMPLSVRRTYTAAYLDAKKEETRINRLKKIIERLNDNKRPM